ncbi:MAG: D-alanyl-D-alanine carboxypeptidase [Candidatus Sungbacteria bacterium]|nr:D-alanyl-D-alanine carboxypeptidase [Candidatus Sungbacteria bacterium]
MNYESPFIKNSVIVLGVIALGFFAFTKISKPFEDTPPAIREQTASEIAALKRIRPTAVIPEPEGIDAESYVVRLVGEKTPLLSRRELKRMPPASLTKLMTATIAAEELASSDLVTFSAIAKKVDPTQSSAAAGESFLRDDMLKFAVIASANDAAYAIAETIQKKHRSRSAAMAAATTTSFTDLMNQKAARIGMTDSHFQNPIGLDDPDHFMSAADVARLLDHIFYTHQNIFEISRTVETTVYSVNRKSHTIENTNDLLKEFPAILGSKTGFTNAAQGTLAMLYPVKPNHVALIVLMGSHDRFGDGRKLITWLENSFSAEGGQ